jgi:hypothetical protein
VAAGLLVPQGNVVVPAVLGVEASCNLRGPPNGGAEAMRVLVAMAALRWKTSRDECIEVVQIWEKRNWTLLLFYSAESTQKLTASEPHSVIDNATTSARAP